MDKLDISYDTVDITQDIGAYDMLIGKGFRSAPVVITDDDAWAGFVPDKINGLVN
jgi:glutaredoxin-like protein NrdH